VGIRSRRRLGTDHGEQARPRMPIQLLDKRLRDNHLTPVAGDLNHPCPVARCHLRMRLPKNPP
jgi:hypothetical protein